MCCFDYVFALGLCGAWVWSLCFALIVECFLYKFVIVIVRYLFRGLLLRYEFCGAVGLEFGLPFCMFVYDMYLVVFGVGTLRAVACR